MSFVESDVIPASHSGYVTVNRCDHLFFWYFPHTDPVNDRLMLWLSAGPGASPMMAVFLENGPLQLVTNGSGGFRRKAKNSKSNWAGEYGEFHML